MVSNLAMSLIYLLGAYLTTVILLMVIVYLLNQYHEEIKPDETLESWFDNPLFQKTAPLHPIFTLSVFSPFALLYLNNFAQNGRQLLYMFFVGLIWTIITAAGDFLIWYFTKDYLKISFERLYIKYEPWLGLIYGSIFLSPFIASIFM